jgi:hypothetical protein
MCGRADGPGLNGAGGRGGGGGRFGLLSRPEVTSRYGGPPSQGWRGGGRHLSDASDHVPLSRPAITSRCRVPLSITSPCHVPLVTCLLPRRAVPRRGEGGLAGGGAQKRSAADRRDAPLSRPPITSSYHVPLSRRQL